jgi:uncharacterized protein YjbI with pentapeptide repeats
MATVASTRTIDARGVEISSELFSLITESVPDMHWIDAQFDAATFDGNATFTDASFERRASFVKAVFKGETNFDSVTFDGNATFTHASFERRASFYKAVFKGEPNFDSVTCCCDAIFSGAHFLSERDWASFWNSQIHGTAFFDGVDSHGQFHFGQTWVRDATFEGAHFRQKCTFDPTDIGRKANFCEVIFDDIADFKGSQFGSPPEFSDATFRSEFQLQGLSVLGTIDVASEPSAAPKDRSIVLNNVQFQRGVELVLRDGAVLKVENTLFGGPSTIRNEPRITDHNERGVKPEQPVISSLRWSDVGNLLLSGVDLKDCLFDGAHNLDRLRMENRTSLRRPPPMAWQRRWRFVPVAFHWSQREILYEEDIWRATNQSDRWTDLPHDAPPALAAKDVAAIYRSLRKGREDNKDAPGASDFYYGEMEMRRLDTSSSRTDRFVLFLYWLLSGYALRASRAFAAFVIFTGISTLLFYYFGFSHSVSVQRAVAVGIQNTTNILGLQRDVLINNGWGLVLYALQHLIGTLLIGLTVVSFRGRLQR